MPEQPVGRRGVIAGGVLALVLVAFGVFVLPFAFTTPPPIITRFTSTRIFSPGSTTGRADGRVSIRLSEPSMVVITIKDQQGKVVRTLVNREVRTRTYSVPWDGRADDGGALAGGTYTIDLNATAGQKKFSKSRRMVIDTTAPGAPAVKVSGSAAACIAIVTGPGEATRLVVTALGTGAHSDPRDLPAGGTFTWTWNRDSATGARVPGPTRIAATVSDAAGNHAVTIRTCPKAGAR